jgi:hypothetical protein
MHFIPGTLKMALEILREVEILCESFAGGNKRCQ